MTQPPEMPDEVKRMLKALTAPDNPDEAALAEIRDREWERRANMIDAIPELNIPEIPRSWLERYWWSPQCHHEHVICRVLTYAIGVATGALAGSCITYLVRR